MELLNVKTMADGRTLRIYRQITPATEPVPERLIRYVISSIGFDSYREHVHEQNFWRLHYRTAFAGEGCIDHLYLAEVDGTFAARVWFAYSPETGFGNFGNVYTEPAFRRLGLMWDLLQYCVKDFYDSPAQLLCCGTETAYAAATYRKAGFQMIYGGEIGLMHIIDPKAGAHFIDLEKKYFDGSKIQNIRSGEPRDQFACDKFLVYTSALQGPDSAWGSTGPDAYICDYRTAWQEHKNGIAVTAVAENAKGAVCAYAYAVKAFGRNCLNFVVHPDNKGEIRELLDFTASEFRKKYPGEPLMIYLASNYHIQLEALKLAGLTPVATVGDLVIFEF